MGNIWWKKTPSTYGTICTDHSKPEEVVRTLVHGMSWLGEGMTTCRVALYGGKSIVQLPKGAYIAGVYCKDLIAAYHRDTTETEEYALCVSPAGEPPAEWIYLGLCDAGLVFVSRKASDIEAVKKDGHHRQMTTDELEKVIAANQPQMRIANVLSKDQARYFLSQLSPAVVEKIQKLLPAMLKDAEEMGTEDVFDLLTGKSDGFDQPTIVEGK